MKEEKENAWQNRFLNFCPEIYIFLSHYFNMFQHNGFLLNVVESLDAETLGVSLKNITNSFKLKNSTRCAFWTGCTGEWSLCPAACRELGVCSEHIQGLQPEQAGAARAEAPPCCCWLCALSQGSSRPEGHLVASAHGAPCCEPHAFITLHYQNCKFYPREMARHHFEAKYPLG